MVTRRSTTFGIEQLALAEVRDSDGRRWTADTRARYANDRGEWLPQLAACK